MLNTIINNIPYGILAGGLTLLLAIILRPLAHIIGLLDTPGGRKKHTGNIPLIGGICLYVTFATTFFATSRAIPEIQSLIISTTLLLLIGILDDFLDIRAIYKLAVQFAATGLMIYQTDIYINQIAFLENGQIIELGWAGYLLTVIAIVGITNSFNMSDGIDGLAGLQVLISMLAVSTIIILLGRELIHEPYLDIFRGAIIGYLLINLTIISQHKIFLGDSGSMTIGFICAWVVVYYSQLPPEKGLPPSLALWVLAVPTIDMLTLIIRRLLLKRSPFTADRKHLHHIFMRLGLNTHQILAIISLISIMLMIIGLTLYLLMGDIAAIIGFIVVSVLYYIVIKRIWKITKFLRKILS